MTSPHRKPDSICTQPSVRREQSKRLNTVFMTSQIESNPRRRTCLCAKLWKHAMNSSRYDMILLHIALCTLHLLVIFPPAARPPLRRIMRFYDTPVSISCKHDVMHSWRRDIVNQTPPVLTPARGGDEWQRLNTAFMTSRIHDTHLIAHLNG